MSTESSVVSNSAATVNTIAVDVSPGAADARRAPASQFGINLRGLTSSTRSMGEPLVRPPNSAPAKIQQDPIVPRSPLTLTTTEIEEQAQVLPKEESNNLAKYLVGFVQYLLDSGLASDLYYKGILRLTTGKPWEERRAEELIPQLEAFVDNMKYSIPFYTDHQIKIETNKGQKVSWISRFVKGALSFFGIGDKKEGINDSIGAAVEWANDPDANGASFRAQDALKEYYNTVEALVPWFMDNWKEVYDVGKGKPRWGELKRHFNIVAYQWLDIQGVDRYTSEINYGRPGQLEGGGRRANNRYEPRYAPLQDLSVDYLNSANIYSSNMPVTRFGSLQTLLAQYETIMRTVGKTQSGKVEAIRISNLIYAECKRRTTQLRSIPGPWVFNITRVEPIEKKR